jgi:hypothetical protein
MMMFMSLIYFLRALNFFRGTFGAFFGALDLLAQFFALHPSSLPKKLFG